MYIRFLYDSGSDCGSRKNMSDTNATDSINSQQTAETVSRAKEDQQTQLAAAQKAIDDARMLITHRVLCGIRVKINRMQNFSLC